MEEILSVRIDKQKKEYGGEVLRRLGSSPSSAVRQLYDYVIAHDELPFEKATKEKSRAEIAEKIRRFDALSGHPTNLAATLSDDDIRTARIAERYEV